MEMIDALQRVLDKSHILDGGTGLWKRHPSLSRGFCQFSSDYAHFRRLAGQVVSSSETTAGLEAGGGEMLEALAEDLLFAGIDTTSHLVAFGLYNLATNQDAQMSLLNEVKSNQPGQPGK